MKIGVTPAPDMNVDLAFKKVDEASFLGLKSDQPVLVTAQLNRSINPHKDKLDFTEPQVQLNTQEDDSLNPEIEINLPLDEHDQDVQQSGILIEESAGGESHRNSPDETNI